MPFLLIVLLFVFSQTLFAQQETTDTLPEEVTDQQGWLIYDDGNKVSGQLISANVEGGLFQSDRFGEIAYSTEDARFQSGLEDGFVPTKDTPVPSDSEPVVANVASEPAAKKNPWIPDSWHIDGSFLWKSGDTERSNESDIEFGASWLGESTTSRLTLRNKYKFKNSKTDTNEQSARFRWIRNNTSRLYTMFDVYGERDQSELLDIDNDYFLFTSGGGGGLHFDWKDTNVARIGLLYNWMYLKLLDYDVSVDVDVWSVFLSLDFDLTERITLHQWAKYYLWESGSNGIESEIDLNYRITEHLSLGLLHKYEDEAPSIQTTHDNELKVYTRLKF